MDGSGGLKLVGEPELMAPGPLPGYFILTFALGNDGRDVAVVTAGDLALVGEDGDPVKATFTFDREDRRPGAAVQAKRAALSPRGSVRVIAVWREEEAARLEYPGGSASLEDAAVTSALHA